MVRVQSNCCSSCWLRASYSSKRDKFTEKDAVGIVRCVFFLGRVSRFSPDPRSNYQMWTRNTFTSMILFIMTSSAFEIPKCLPTMNSPWPSRNARPEFCTMEESTCTLHMTSRIPWWEFLVILVVHKDGHRKPVDVWATG